MSEFKPLEPRNLGHFTDVEVKTVSKHTPGPWVWDGHWLSAPGSGLILWYKSDDNGVHAKPADARLIAAAPDLLAALIDIRDNVMSDRPQMWQRIDAAIAKATGETP